MATVEAIPTSTIQAQEQSYTRKDLVKTWSFPLQPLHDFELNGESAQYAPGYPKMQGDERETIDLKGAIGSEHQERSWESSTAAISPDKKLLAVTSNHKCILVYDLESQGLRQILDGAGDIVFCPHLQSNETATEGISVESSTKPAYTFVCSTPDKDSKTGLHNRLVFWELDRHGRLLDHEEPIDASAYAAQAIDAILPDLVRKHEWSRKFVDATSLHEDFAKLLSVVDMAHRRRHNTIYNNAQLGKFNSTPFSSDGRLFLYHTQNSVNASSREPKDLPSIVVMDVLAGKELHRLSGHTDAICWSAISPDNDHIASISCDGALRMYSATTGDLEWATNPGGRSWTGAFSADSKRIVWSSCNGLAIFIQDVNGGRTISTFPGTLQHLCPSLAWHPDGGQVALCAGKHAYVWHPFDGINGTIAQHHQVEDENNSQALVDVLRVAWLGNGRLLHLYMSDGTSLVYDTQCNLKELFVHPQGVDVPWTNNGFHSGIKISGDQEGYVSVDSDDKVRYWSSGVVTRDSWWEKAPKKDERVKETVTTKRAPFPETGRYVMVIRPAEKGKDEQQVDVSRVFSTDNGVDMRSA